MTPRDREVLVAQLWATRASVDAALVTLGELVTEQPTDTAAECTHPTELRDDLTEFGGPLEWRCRGCGFHSITDNED